MDALIPKLMEQGVVVMSFVWLLKYTLETATNRENRLMDFMDNLKDELHGLSGVVGKLAEDMEDVKEKVTNNNK